MNIHPNNLFTNMTPKVKITSKDARLEEKELKTTKFMKNKIISYKKDKTILSILNYMSKKGKLYTFPPFKNSN
jgi:predicted transcriptional regulator